MITEIDGNIFETSSNVLVNPVNCVGVMGAGLALEFKKRFPDMFIQYQYACKFGHVRLGHVWSCFDNDKLIICFPTKHHWRHKSRIYDIRTGLVSLSSYCIAYDIKEIAMPKIGCGLGGLSWEDEVRPLVYDRLSDNPTTVLVYI